MKKSYFFLGLIIFYFILFLAPNKPVYFSAFIIVSSFFYLATKNIRVSLLYSMILSLFSEAGLGGSLFVMEPKELNLGSGWWFSPMTMMIILLLPFSLYRKIKSVNKADIILILFSFWLVITFIVWPYTNVLYGVMTLFEIFIAYYLLRIYIDKENIKYISYLLISMLAFQSIIGSLQFIFQRPIGAVIESSQFAYPFGLTTKEDINLFRISGGFVHPNYFASFLLGILPFLLIYPSGNLFLSIAKILSLVSMFLTYSRAAWVIFVVLVVLLILTRQIRFKISKLTSLYYYLIPIASTLIFIYLTPYFSIRFDSFPQAFEEWGSFGVRTKVIREGLSLVEQYPFIGVGLNRSLQTYAENPLTDLFQKARPSDFYKIHNTFLEIASETGITGFLLFACFLFLVLKRYFVGELVYHKSAAFFGLLSLLGIFMFNPFLYTSQFRLFFLLAAIILA